MDNDLQRFVDAQNREYSKALDEIKEGKKTTHWIWYIFPQIKGLGRSYYSEFYGIQSIEEARAYLDHDILSNRLYEITGALLLHKDKSIVEIAGHIDSKKIKSSMTLFDYISPNDVFDQVLSVFFSGKR